jgi:hypothetical protein
MRKYRCHAKRNTAELFVIQDAVSVFVSGPSRKSSPVDLMTHVVRGERGGTSLDYYVLYYKIYYYRYGASMLN